MRENNQQKNKNGTIKCVYFFVPLQKFNNKKNKFMALPINIEDLLHRQKIEGNRIEFKSSSLPKSKIR